MTRSQKEDLLKNLLLLRAQRDKNKLSRFKPNPGFQEDFFRSKKRIRLATAGNQSGKTTVGAIESAHYALGTHPHKKIRTPNVGVIVSAQGFKEGIEKIVMPKIRSVVGSQDIIRIKNNTQGIPTEIVWRNGSITHLMSAEQDDKVFEGITLDWVWIDEPVRRSIFIALKRGMLTTGGHLWMSCTPLDEPWIYEEIYMPAKEGRDDSIAVFEGSSDENAYIPEEEKEEFKKRLTSDEIEARWYGKFRHLSGRVFKSYKPEIHRIKDFDIPEHWPVWMSIDPHRNKPHGVLWVAISPKNVKYVCNEIYISCTPRKLAEYILSINQQYNIVQQLIDTSSQEDGWNKRSLRQMLQDYGVRTKLAQKKNKKNSRIHLINQSLSNNELFVMEHCKRLHREFQNQIYKKNKMDSAKILEEPEKKFDDQTDNLGYIYTENPTYRGIPSIKEIGPIYVRG